LYKKCRKRDKNMVLLNAQNKNNCPKLRKEEFYYDSEDNKTQIHAIRWIPIGEIRCILQISHGMLEHIERYDDFARALVEKGVFVVGNDHLGHGSSLLREEDRGYFCQDDGNTVLIEDIYNLMKIIKNKYPTAPYFLLGHSMGSFLIRQFISIYGDDIDGAIIVGTGHQPYGLIKLGQLVIAFISVFKGWKYRSRFVNYLAIGGYNKKFEPSRTSVDWLSRDEEVVDKYLADPRITFIFTLNAYYNMFKGMSYLYKKQFIEKIPKELPIKLLSGKNDPVGRFGKDVKKVYDEYISLGMKNVSLKLYDDYRHEIINELNKEVVYNDIINWLSEMIS